MRKQLAFCTLLSLLALPSGAQAQTTLTIATLEQPPSTFTKDGVVQGISTELLQQALAANKIVAPITSYPWARSYDMALNDPMTCAYLATRTEEREKLFKWVGPLAKKTWLLVGRADSPKVASLAEVKSKGYTIGGIVGFAETKFLIAEGLKVDAAPNDVLNPEKLASGRIDFWAQQKIEGKVSPEIPPEFPVVLEFKDVDQYLACNKSVPDDVIENLNREIAALTEKGVLKDLINKYLP